MHLLQTSQTRKAHRGLPPNDMACS